MAKQKYGQKISKMHSALHDFVGNWNVSQKVWSEPNGEPATYKGKTKCTTVLGGLGTLMVTEIKATGFQGMGLMTFNTKTSSYDMAWLDTISDQGILIMGGEQRQVASNAMLRSEFGKSATQQREWTTALETESACLPGDSLDAAATFAAETSAKARTAGKATSVPMRLVENKISDNQWVLEFYVPGPSGKDFLVQQNTFTRAGR